MLTALIGLLGIGGVAGLALKFFGWTAIKTWAKSIPPKAWIALAIVGVLVGGYLWINHKIHAAYVQGKKDGHAAQFAYDQAQLDKIRAQARAFKQKLDDANTRIQTEEKARHDQTVAANRALADALRVRIGTKAKPGGGGSANLPSTAPPGVSAGGPQPPADAGLGQGADRPLILVDANRLIDYAEQADNDHDALVRTEDAHKRYQQSWPSGVTAPPDR